MLSIEFINIWKAVIKSFKQRNDVINGEVLGFKGTKNYSLPEDTPISIVDGLSTTGWCVSASEALTEDEYFQFVAETTKTQYRLISIDIKEQYYGHCYNGSQNKWHTAILLSYYPDGEKTPINFIIDITCRQFGDNFIDKDIWDLDTWLKTLRSSLCKHYIPEVDKDNDNRPLEIDNKSKNIKDFEEMLLNYSLKDHTLLDDNQRKVISTIFNNFSHINNQILLNNLSQSEFDLVSEFNTILSNMSIEHVQEGYSVLEFPNRNICKNWLEILLRNSGKLPHYIYVSKSIEDSCNFKNINYGELFSKGTLNVEDNKTFLIIKFNNVNLIEFNLPNISNIAEYSQKFMMKNNSIYDFAVRQNPENKKKSNTIIVELF